jgi:hypothetical protein
MKRYLLIILVFLALSKIGLGQKSKSSNALVAGLNPVSGLLKYEPGFSSALLYRRAKFVAETRCTFGRKTDYYTNTYYHGGISYIISNYNIGHGAFVGAFLRYNKLHNLKTEIDVFNLIPYITMGYRYEGKYVYFDLRMKKNMYAWTWSNRENTNVSHDWVFKPKHDYPFMTFYFTIGYVLFNTADQP